MKIELSLFASALLMTGSAFASLPYPPLVQNYLMLDHPLECTLCHTVDPGREGTANRPFARTLRTEFEVIGNDTRSLINGLRAMDAYDVDSDGDGVHDLDELRRGNNPNDPADGPAEPEPEPEPDPDPEPEPTTGGAINGGEGGTEGIDTAESTVTTAATSGSTRGTRLPQPDPEPLPPTLETGCALSSPAPGGGVTVAAWLLLLAFAALHNRRSRSLVDSELPAQVHRPGGSGPVLPGGEEIAREVDLE